MNNFQSFRFEITRDTNPKHNRISIRAERGTESKGLNYLWFVMFTDEFKQASQGSGAYQDGYHKLDVMGDYWLFYDMENYPRNETGVMDIRYARLTIPAFIARAVYRLACKKLATMKPEEKFIIDLTPERIKRILSLYGCGHGKVSLDLTDPRVSDKYVTLSTDKGFYNNIERLKQIALNTTRAFYNTAVVKLYPDSSGFGFAIYTPNGNCTMNGGLINHGTDLASDWSIHT